MAPRARWRPGCAVVVLLLAILVLGGPAAGGDEPLIRVSREGVVPTRLEVHVGEVVRWRAEGRAGVHLDMDRHPQGHEVIQRLGEVRAIFLQPGEHSYTAHLLGDGRRTFRGTVVVREGTAPAEEILRCAPESSPRICFEP